ncbi:pathogenesis-related thaumatin-like protein 3.5 [Humulus lupulus]|uniref:pathogenesis-related thaumatin-like protein 3.5 n=1 Tax=Humulus lupulus TaxID=3486 RepID=UPI002B40BE6B|nr:pathogenesis-related thaumatin-like protein 3.5 [Humulus lupulus]
MALSSTNPISLLLRPLIICLIITTSGPKLSESRKNFAIVNYCKEMIWPAMTNSDNFTGGGIPALKPGQSMVYTAPPQWSGRIWARTGCDFDKDGNGKCQTGSCGSLLNCTGPGSPPASIAEFNLNETIDYYDVSLVDGFNLPIVVKPSNGTGNCSSVGCEGDLRQSCPAELQAKASGGGKVIACRSACDVFNNDEYCCRGTYSNPVSCVATNYSRIFKEFCPMAYSFAHDDPTSVITCSGADYTVTFCGSRNQTFCSYNDNKLVCSGSKSVKALLSHKWYWGFILTLPFIFINDQHFQSVP